MSTNSANAPLLEVDHLRCTFRAGHRLLGGESVTRAVDDVSFALARGEAFGLVGESGSGKTTIGRAIVRLIEPDGGVIRFRGAAVGGLHGRALLAYRRQVQMVFQNPFASLNPRRRVRDILADGYEIHGIARGREARRQLDQLMLRVGLRAEMLDRYPHEFSSGQRQRIGLARALSVEPSLIVADEPVSALDVSVQAQVLNLMRSLQAELGLTVLLISHDLRAVAFLCDRIGVLYLGQLMEVGPREIVVDRPAHPYTQALIRSIPSLVPGAGVSRELIQGEIADQAPPSGGCVFAPRCALRQQLGSPRRCEIDRPELRSVAGGHAAACHFAEAGDVSLVNGPTAYDTLEAPQSA